MHILRERIERDNHVEKRKVPTHLLDVGRPPKVEAAYPPATEVSVKDRKILVGLGSNFSVDDFWW